MIQEKYTAHWDAIKKQLQEQGYVLLLDAVTHVPTGTNKTEQKKNPRLHSYTIQETPEEIYALYQLMQKEVGLVGELHVETKQYTGGDFELLESPQATNCYEIVLFSCQEWSVEKRGEHFYTTEDGLCVQPQDKQILIIYKDAETKKYVKRIPIQTTQKLITHTATIQKKQ